MTKSFGTLIPSIEQRETGWLQIRARLARDGREVAHPTITISREFGCEGHALAQRLRELLDEASTEPWEVFDKALVEKVGEDEKLSRHILSRLGDESHAGDVLKTQFGFLTHDDVYASVLKHLLGIAQAGCAIIVGRGGALACQGLPNCFHFRLVGSLAFRTATLARRRGLPLAEAEELVRVQSRLREKFVSDHLHADITLPQWYDAVFNNERQDVDTIARACLLLVMTKWPEQSFFKHPKG
jgi:Cytidylate kinase-like family